MPRYWRIVSNFHTIGEVIKIVQAPNWQGGMRKGVLAVKADARLKGKKIVVASFTLQESSGEAAVALWAAESPLGQAQQAIQPDVNPFGEGTPNTLGAQRRAENQGQAIQANEVPARPASPEDPETGR